MLSLPSRGKFADDTRCDMMLEMHDDDDNDDDDGGGSDGDVDEEQFRFRENKLPLSSE